MSGWIKLQRDIMDHWIAQDAEYLSVWIRMLSEANFESRTLMFNGQVISVGRGQLIFGLKTYSEKTKMTEMRLRTLLSLLEKNQMINRVKNSKYSLISIVNYDKYQSDNRHVSASEQPDNSQTPVSQQAGNNTIRSKEYKEDKKKRRSAKSVDFEPSQNISFSQKAFDIFWNNVEQRRAGKAEALKAFEKYTAGRSEDEIDFMLNVICHWYDLYLKEDESRLLPENKRFLKHASTWLNSEPWKADPQAFAEFKRNYYGEQNEG